MKIDNYLWGCLRIRDELIKLNIDISRETIRKIISDFRKQNIIKPNYSWSTFLKSHWNITTNPTIKFLRPQISLFEENFPNSYLIHDNSGELKYFPYKDYNIKEYIHYYNNYRPHQGINGIPNGKYPPENNKGNIKKQSLLFGLNNHHYREAS
ncbi:hypothetical protein EW093_05730 [Thiospirochaeta perfilievii]|uniref:Integrase catalytic domain-containing protein n=1 Tax=Thiospirochaeta perfilievii TaxID=252967 RepID=A0A5C1Q855_9SPIO|nr:hypothetical protein [Thiospirochaeta perfilievii]QEN04225.1 hypothetical protein EW093_05730 [Thiospirochaeta perfilievii]